MTRRDYELIAAVVKKLYVFEKDGAKFSPSFRAGVEMVATHLADELITDNPQFSRAKFMEACGIYPPRIKKTQ